MRGKEEGAEGPVYHVQLITLNIDLNEERASVHSLCPRNPGKFDQAVHLRVGASCQSQPA